jgi:aryl-alcohol dehydrogenase-like predicted oxidoreductase
VRYIGLSEAGVDSIRRAQSVHPISDLQIEYSLLSRGIEDGILPVCRELGIGITAYGVLSRGLIGGRFARDRSVAPGDFRSRAPRFHGENLEHNLRLIEALEAIAEEKGIPAAQLAIAWVLSRGNDIVPVVGSKTRSQLQSAVTAADVILSPRDLARIEAAVPPDAVAGTRYDAAQMAQLDSERR